eukprot:TRINITY_DN592_c0_g1_i1.p1 TRINITY_DN592_c0_g1~~TRINITY_DN592_c0_g1_i1.p1  ORF type:complete len:440 (-),score=91.05 TRINITY_DN592_c0_g1_i1:249-1568(-)
MARVLLRSAICSAALSSRLTLGSSVRVLPASRSAQAVLNNQTRSFRSSGALHQEKKDYYEILGVPRDASQHEIKKAYYRLAKQFHPDTNRGDNEAEKKFQLVNEAYEILGNEEKRKRFDTYGFAGDAGDAAGPGGAYGGFDPRDLFRQFEQQFGDIFGLHDVFNVRAAPRRGQDIEVAVEIDFMEAIRGCRREVQVDRFGDCSTCHGSGAQPGTKSQKCGKCKGTGSITLQQGPYVLQTGCRRCQGTGTITTPCKTCDGRGVALEKATVAVSIPAGVDNGQAIRVSGQGSASSDVGGQAGHLWVRVKVKEHSVFQRDGLDVHVYCPVSLSQAVLGGTVVVPTLESEVELKIPTGTQSGDRVVMRGKGIRKPSSNLTGNQYVHFDVEIPKKLTPRMEELFKELAEEEKKVPRTYTPGHKSSWFQKLKELMDFKKKREDSS